MSDKHKLKTSMSDETVSNLALSPNPKGARLDPSGPYEVFRNNTTAVEVIVKEVPHKKKPHVPRCPDSTVKKLLEDIDLLKIELNKANTTIEKSKIGFKSVICELQKQLDGSSQRELEVQAKNLSLQLENEKLRMILECKTTIVGKFKKELTSLRRIIKCVIKGIACAPEVEHPISSDLEYDDFENYLGKQAKVRFTSNGYEETCTFDSSVSKELKKSFEKQFS